MRRPALDGGGSPEALIASPSPAVTLVAVPVEKPDVTITTGDAVHATVGEVAQRVDDVPPHPLDIIEQLQGVQRLDTSADLRQDMNCGGYISWEFVDLHPMVTESEKAYIEICLGMLDHLLADGGGLAPYAQDANPKLVDLIGRQSRCMEPETLLLRSFEALLQREARSGADTIFVEPWHLNSQGTKKIVKLELTTESVVIPATLCWDWDVKLEQRLPM